MQRLPFSRTRAVRLCGGFAIKEPFRRKLGGKKTPTALDTAGSTSHRTPRSARSEFNRADRPQQRRPAMEPPPDKRRRVDTGSTLPVISEEGTSAASAAAAAPVPAGRQVPVDLRGLLEERVGGASGGAGGDGGAEPIRVTHGVDRIAASRALPTVQVHKQSSSLLVISRPFSDRLLVFTGSGTASRRR